MRMTGWIGLMLLTMSAQVTARQDASAMELGTDRPGYDFGDFAIDNGAAECLQRCRDDARCRAWTFVGEQAPDGSGTCWLKDRVPPARPMTHAVSGSVEPEPEHPEWARSYAVDRDVDWADLVVQTGDIDNFSFGWPADFTPFSGRQTPRHAFPFAPESDDPDGTDRIMVPSSYNGHPPRGNDGYVETTGRPDNQPRPIVVDLPDAMPAIETVMLQLLVDDFQAPIFAAHYRVAIDGERMPGMELGINALRQTGPVGKLVSFGLLPEYHHLLQDGRLEIAIDDPTSGAGDGFAIDFVRVLINPKTLPERGRVGGRVSDAQSGAALSGALVSTALGQVETAPDGSYRIENVPAGLAVVRAASAGYVPSAATSDLVDGATVKLDFRLAPRQLDQAELARQLGQSGRVEIPGIFFELDSAALKSASKTALDAVLAVLGAQPDRRYVIEGHTDSQGDAAYNLDLSTRRARAVADWLIGRGIAADRLATQGYGETHPTADNTTAAGRALNRRVELARIE